MPEHHVVIVTGAAAGLGRVMTLALLGAGRCVAGVDIAPAAPALHDLASTLDADAARRFLPCTGSVRTSDDCDRVVGETIARFGCVDALVNNAGLGMAAMRPEAALGTPLVTRHGGRMPAVPFYDVPLEKWEALIDTNLNGPFRMARAVAPHLVAQAWGRIVNVTTGHATMIRGGTSPYGPAKAALEAATVVWADDLAGTGVTVNVLIPGGAADTAMIPGESVSDRTQLVAPSVMAAPVVWLTSHESDGVTGRRFIGRDWDPGLATERNVEAASAVAGWTS